MKTVYADLDDILFETRERKYGAYQARKKANRFLLRATMIAFLLFLFVTALPKVVSWLTPEPEEEEPEIVAVVPVKLSDLPPPPSIDEEETPPPPPKVNLPPPKRSTIEFKVPEPKPEDEIEEEKTIEEMDDIEESTPDFETQEGDPNAGYDWGEIDGEGDVEVVEVVEEKKEKEIGPNEFVLLEKEPAPVNMDDIKKLIGYPPMAKEAEIEGKVILRVQVDINGSYVRHIKIKDPHPILTKAVEDQIRNLKFTPGIQAGKPIKVWVTIPFDFKLLK